MREAGILPLKSRSSYPERPRRSGRSALLILGMQTFTDFVEDGDASRMSVAETFLICCTGNYEVADTFVTIMNVKILTFNTGLLELSLGPLHFDVVPFVDERANFLPEALRRSGADVICLQEVFRLEDMERLRTLADIYPYIYVYEHKNITKRSGLCILSKYPFLVKAEMRFRTSGLEKFVRKGAVKIQITDGLYAGIEVVNAHFPYGGYGSYSQTLPRTVKMRAKNIRHLHKKIHSETNTTIVAGDFNFGPTVSPENFRLIKSLGYEQVSNGEITWDVENPLNLMFPASVSKTIDHIFVNKKRDFEFSVLQSIRVFDTEIEHNGVSFFLSDHFGVMCEIEL